MRLTLFGATGRTGQQVLARALAQGHEVAVLARHPAKLNAGGPNLTVIQGDVQDPEQVMRAVQEAQAVISVLGPTHNRPTYAISPGIDHILAAMRETGVRRLVLTAGAGVGDARDAPGVFHHAITWLLKLFSRHVFEDMVRVVTKVRASEVDWTVVRVPMLTDGPATGNVQAGYVGQGMGRSISRADLAQFLLQQVDSTEFIHQAPVISQK